MCKRATLCISLDYERLFTRSLSTAIIIQSMKLQLTSKRNEEKEAEALKALKLRLIWREMFEIIFSYEFIMFDWSS